MGFKEFREEFRRNLALQKARFKIDKKKGDKDGDKS